MPSRSLSRGAFPSPISSASGMPSPSLSAVGSGSSPASGGAASSVCASGALAPASGGPASGGSGDLHAWASHTWPLAQSASLWHVLLQLVAPHSYGLQFRCVAFSQPPEPSQLTAPVATPFLHAGAPQLTEEPG